MSSRVVGKQEIASAVTHGLRYKSGWWLLEGFALIWIAVCFFVVLMASEMLASSSNSNSFVKIDIDSPPNPESVANNQPSNTCTNNQQHPREPEENSRQTGRPRSIHEKEARNLLDVEEEKTLDGKTLKKGLEIWERDLHVQQKRIDRKEAQSNQIKNEVYQLVGFFIVFQGVLYTAVAQAQVLRCRNWPTVFVLSLLASAAAILGVSQKLSQIRALRRTIEKEQHMPKVTLLFFLRFSPLFFF